MLLFNRYSRSAAQGSALLAALGMIAATGEAHPLLPGTTLITPALNPALIVGQGTTADADARVASGDFNGAISIYFGLITAAPKVFKNYLGRGIAYFKAGQFDKSAQDFSTFITLRPALVEGYLNRAYAYNALNKSAEGLADLAKVESLDPARVDQKLRGDLLMLKPDYAGSVAAYTKYAATGGDAAGVGNLLVGDAYAAQKDMASAIAAYSRGIAAAPKNPYGYRQRGQLYYSDKKYDLAIKDLTQAIALAPADEAGYYYRGLANLNLKTAPGYGAAKTDFSKFLTLTKEPKDRLLGMKFLAQAQKGSGDVKGEIETYTAILALNQKEADAVFLRGMAYMQQKNYPGAIKDFKTYADSFPKGTNAGDAAFNLGSAYVATSDYKNAVPAFSTALAVNPKDSSSYYGRMLSNFNLKQYDRVPADADQAAATATDPKSPEVVDTYRLEAVAFDKLAQNGDKTAGAKAIAAAKKHRELSPKDAVAQALYTDMVTKYADPTSQIPIYIAAAANATNPKEKAGILYNLGVAYSQTKDLDKAITAFSQAAALTPTDGGTFLALAQTQVAKGQTDAAIVSYGKAISLSPDKPELLEERGNLYVDKKEYAKADADFTAYLAKAGDKADQGVVFTEAQLKKVQGKPDEAITMYLKFLSVTKDDAKTAEARKQLGAVYLDKKDYPNAIKTYTDYLAKNPKDGDALINRAIAHRLSGDNDKALADANAAVAAAPTSAPALAERAATNNKIGDKLGETDPDAAAKAWDSSIADCDKAIAAAPKYAFAYYYKGFAAYKNASDKGKGDAKTYNPIALDAMTKFLSLAAPNDPARKSAQGVIDDIKGAK